MALDLFVLFTKLNPVLLDYLAIIHYSALDLLVVFAVYFSCLDYHDFLSTLPSCNTQSIALKSTETTIYEMTSKTPYNKKTHKQTIKTGQENLVYTRSFLELLHRSR
jgi:hypothetical protein